MYSMYSLYVNCIGKDVYYILSRFVENYTYPNMLFQYALIFSNLHMYSVILNYTLEYMKSSMYQWITVCIVFIVNHTQKTLQM